MSKTLRIAVIGAGNHSALHHGSSLKSFAASHPGEIELAAVCDLDAAKARAYAESFGFAKTYVDYKAMLSAEKLDGIVAVTPVSATAMVAADLLARGIPMVIEKPTGETAAETRRLLEIAAARKAPHMVSFNRRYIPAVTKAREWLAGPGKGRPPRIVVGRMLRSERREKEFVTGTGIHLIDTIVSFMGTPRHAVTSRSPAGAPDRWLYDSLLDFGGGASAAVIISPMVGTEEETVEIHGQDYAIQIDTVRCALRVSDGGKQVLSWESPGGAEYAFVCGALPETEAFIRSIRTGKGFWPELHDSLVTMVTAEAIEAGGEAAIAL
jgi:predicted dehydrogenase